MLFKNQPRKPNNMKKLQPQTNGVVVAPEEKYELPRKEWDPIQQYLREMGKTPLLTRAEEIELMKRVRAGDKAARAHAIKANLRLVVKIANERQFRFCGLPLIDRINDGNIGLMKAVRRYKAEKGTKLSTYASWWIKQSIKLGISNHCKTIRVPVHMINIIRKVNKITEQLHAEYGVAPTDEEIAQRLKISLKKMAKIREACLITVSLDTPIGDDDGGSIVDVVADPNSVSATEEISVDDNKRIVRDLLMTLNQKEQSIIKARFGFNGHEIKTLEEIGVIHKVTKERIRQIEAKALRKLRKSHNRMKALGES